MHRRDYGRTKIRWEKMTRFISEWVEGLVRDTVEDRDGMLEQMIATASASPPTLELQEIRRILIQDTGQQPKTPKCLPVKRPVSHTQGEQRIKKFCPLLITMILPG